MSADFFRTNMPEHLVRGAGRLLVAGMTISSPTQISSVINMSTFDAVSGWSDLGATKTGIQISRNNTEENFEVDQIQGDIYSAPNSWEMSVGTALAEMTPERIAAAWQTGSITTDATPPSGSEYNMGLGLPETYIQRRLAVLFKKSDGKIQGWFFHKAQRMPQESSFTYAKTGDMVQIPVRFKCLPDTSIADIDSRFGIYRVQV